MKKWGIIGGSLLLVLFFLIPDLMLWRDVGSGALPHYPIRNYEGDAAHYNAIAWSAIVDGYPNTNAYFREPVDTHSQFFIAQSLFALTAPFLREISFVWIDLVLKLLVVLASFLMLGKLIEIHGVPRKTAFIISFCFVAVFGHISFRGYAIGYWFFPLFLAALYFTKRFVDMELSPEGTARSLWAVILSAVHPVYFSLVGFANLLGWIALLKKENWSRRGVAFFLVWALSSFALFFVLFFHFLSGSGGGDAAVMRIVGVETRLPIHPVYALGLFLLSYISFQIREFRALSYASLGALVGLLSYMITGRYIANDHYATPFEDIAVFVLACGLVFVPQLKEKIRHRYAWGAAVFFVFVVTAFEHFRYLEFRFGYIGRWTPVILGYGMLVALLLFPRTQDLLKKVFTSRWILIFPVVCLLYGGVLVSKENKLLLESLVQDQEYAPLVDALRGIEPGVILADSAISNLASLYTRHKTYWHPIAFSETVSDAELRARWKDAFVFFSLDPDMSGAGSGFRVLGNANRCFVHGRNDYYELLAEWGFPAWKRDLCDTYAAHRAQWPALLESAEGFRTAVIRGQDWKPIYMLQYLVLDIEKDSVPAPLLKRFFKEKERVNDRFAIYELKQ